MTYASANRKPNPAALAGALGIPGAFGALLVVGLAVTVVTAPPEPRFKAKTITQTKLPPPPPTPDRPQPDRKAATTTTQGPVAPPRPSLPPVAFPLGDPIRAFPGPGDLTGTGTGPIDLGIGGFGPGPGPSASPFDPIGARPKSNPGRWVTNDDYRPRWIMEEMAGTARFTLAIDARGKVAGCTITRSTGHAPLDAATCDLVKRRASFDAARDGSGRPVAGSYTGTITWNIPE